MFVELSTTGMPYARLASVHMYGATLLAEPKNQLYNCLTQLAKYLMNCLPFSTTFLSFAFCLYSTRLDM